MAQSFWLTQRALRLQNDCFTEQGVDEKRLALFSRYHTTHERAFHKAQTALLKLQKQRGRDFKSGFVSQSATDRGRLDIGFVSQNIPGELGMETLSVSERQSPGQFVRQNRHSEAA